jgi:hypothetical protein
VPQTLSRPLPAAASDLCLALETFRRKEEGRIRNEKDFLSAFFPHDASACEDRIFRHLPKDVRARVLTAWGLRGAKTALRDTDEKVRGVVHDALGAGDLDAQEFEEGLDAPMVIRYVPLRAWWSFWRAADLTKNVLGKALTTAHALGLFDAKWFWDTVARGALRGTDAIAEGLSKTELTEWLRAVHTSGDGTPAGLLAAIGWERLLARTPNDVLTAVIDALSAKIGLTGGAVDHAPAEKAADDGPDPASIDAILLEDDDEPTHPPKPIPESIAPRSISPRAVEA